jgi:hypothetical protein
MYFIVYVHLVGILKICVITTQKIHEMESLKVDIYCSCITVSRGSGVTSWALL